MTKVTPQINGLTLWRERQAKEKEKQMEELAKLRRNAVIEVRDGREYTVITVPDKYKWGNE